MLYLHTRHMSRGFASTPASADQIDENLQTLLSAWGHSNLRTIKAISQYTWYLA